LASQRFPLKINVGFLHNEPLGSYRDIHFEFPELHLPPNFDVRQFAGSAHISRTPQGLLIEGFFEAIIPLECVRCLEPLDHLLKPNLMKSTHIKIRFYRIGPYYPEDGNIDLGPVVREYLMLEYPIKPLCKPDCQGLCTVAVKPQLYYLRTSGEDTDRVKIV